MAGRFIMAIKHWNEPLEGFTSLSFVVLFGLLSSLVLAGVADASSICVSCTNFHPFKSLKHTSGLVRAHEESSNHTFFGWPTVLSSKTKNRMLSQEGLRGELKDYQLTQERIQKIAAEQDGVLIVTFANHHYLSLVQNWLAHMKQIQLTTYMIAAMDIQLLQSLLDSGEENVFLMDSVLDRKIGDLSWGSPYFFRLGKEKIEMLGRALEMDVDVIVSDIDTVWLRDPFPYFARYPEAEVLASTDLLHSTTHDEWLENEYYQPNIGVMLLRKSSVNLVKEWVYRLEQEPRLWDQWCFHMMMSRNMSGFEQRNLFRGYNGSTVAGILPISVFANGNTFYFQNLSDTMDVQPYVVHNTYQFSATPGKVHRWRERMLWLIDPAEYYDPEGGVVSFDLHVEEYIEAARHFNIYNADLRAYSPHLALVNNQLSQLRNAMAISSYLNRTLVLPHIWTGSDTLLRPARFLYPIAQNHQLPRRAPADYILAINVWANDTQSNPFSPAIPFREYSFLENPRTPVSLVQDVLQVEMCQEHDPVCQSSLHKHNGSREDTMKIRSRLSVRDIVKVFKNFRDVRRLHFKDVRNLIRGFQHERNAEEFYKRTKEYAWELCCLADGSILKYDMWWDLNKEKPISSNGQYSFANQGS